MKNKRFFSLLSAFLATVMLLGALPLGVFAYEMPKGNSTPNYTEHRGDEGMFEDSNGVMVYYGIEDYYKTSRKDVKLSTEYKTVDDSKSASNTSVVAYYDECPYLYADYAIYFDESIEGTTYKVRYGLSMEDGVYYTDPATREIVKGNVSPIELTASNSNTQNPDYNAGYTMVKGENDELLYTTRHQNDKAIIFYIINHRASDRIGMEDDVSILSDYIAQGYVVVTVDFKSDKQAVTPFVENALVSLRAMFDQYASDAAIKELGLVTNTNNIFFLPEGCRIERDVWFWDPSIYGVIGSMERFRQNWNEMISSEAAVNAADPTKYDTLNIGSVDSVEELISTVTKKDGTPIEYKQTMDIIYPSQPKDGYEAPLYIQEATLPNREQNVLQAYTRVSFASMALNGYACVQYDHSFWPFLYRDDYEFANSGSHYGLSNSSAHMARAAVRCARSLADELGYSSVYAGAAGISKATVGIAILSIKNNKQIPQTAVKAFGVTYSNIAYEGDIYKEGVADKDKGKIPSGATYDPNCELAIVQPFMYYDAACTEEISSDCTVAYNSSGGGVQQLFGEYAKYEKVPMVLSCGTRDDYRCYDYWEEEVAWFDTAALNSFLPMVQLDQGHTYPVGYDNEHGYYRTNAMLKFFDIYLKPDAQRAPEVLWVTPLDGANGVPVSGEWKIGPYTPFKWEVDSYYYDQSIQIRFVDSVDPASVNTGVKVTDASGRVVDGTWVASQKNALSTFECDALEPATAYTIHITRDVKGENGVALAESREVSFTTEGIYLVDSAADTYVSAYAPDKAFGDADVLKIREGYTTLVSFATKNVIDAKEVLLYADVANDANPTAEVYALANTLVDGNLTYAGLTALDAWTNKTLLGTYTVEGDLLAFDFTALADMELGEYVTLAFVSADGPTDTFKYYNGFDDFDFTNPVTKEVDGTTYTVIAENGQLTDGRSAGGKEWNVNTPSSPYVWCRTGPTSFAHIRKVSELTTTYGVPATSQALHVKTTTNGSAQYIKFFNTTTNDVLTAEDVGKTFLVSFDIYPEQEIEIDVGFSMLLACESPYNNVTKIYGDIHKQTVAAGKWSTVTCELTITEELVGIQAGLLTVKLQYPMMDTNPSTFFDNLYVEELLHVYDNDFNTPVNGTALNKTVDGVTYSVVNAGGKVTDARELVNGVYNWDVNTPSSPYLWCRTGATSEAFLRTVAELTAAGVPSDSQAFRATTTKSGTSQIMKFFNVTTDSLLTEADIGKVYRATFDIYTPVDTAIASGFSMVLQVGSNAPGKIYGEKVWTYIPAKTWTTVTMDLPMTAELVALQAGLLSIELQYPAADSVYYTYFDNLRVEELMPALTAKKGAFSLVVTKLTPVNENITVMLDEITELATFAASATVRNEKTGKVVKGEWTAVDESGKSFAFVTDGLEPTSIYTVSVADTVIHRVLVEGDYALRPLVASYVSKSEPAKSFALDAGVALDSDKLGVVTFSAKTLMNADLATLYLDIDTERNSYLRVYVLTDYTPDGALCYNAIAGKLNDEALLEARNVVDGKTAIDLSPLADKMLGDSVTLVFEAGYTFFNDFETPAVTKNTTLSPGQSAQVPGNVSFTDSYIYASQGTNSQALLMPAAGNESQTFRATTYDANGVQWTKFYNTLKSGETLNVGDVGRSYSVSLKIRSEHVQAMYNEGGESATVISVPVGYTHRNSSQLTYNQAKYSSTSRVNEVGAEAISPISIALGGTAQKVDFAVTINEAMAQMQGGMLTFALPTVGAPIYAEDGTTVLERAFIYTFYDDILVKEIIDEAHALMLASDSLILVTENMGAVVLTDADKPVKDAVEGEEEILPNLDATVISYQVSKGEDGVFALRAIAGVDSLNYKYFGYEVTVTTAEGTKMLSGKDTRVYTAILAGETEYSVKDNFGYEYAAFATVKSLALDTAAEILVRAYVVTQDGETLYGRDATLVYSGARDADGYPVVSVKAE